MTDRTWLMRIAAALILALLSGRLPAGAQPAPEAGTTRIGYVQLAHDPRYDPDRAYERVPVRPLERPFAGAQTAIEDAQALGKFLGLHFDLTRQTGDDAHSLAATAVGWAHDGIHFVVADLPPDALLQFADDLRAAPILVLNISARADALRAEQCRENIAHVIPSEAMLTDAAVQYLVSKNWRNVLALQGPGNDDRLAIDALTRSSKRFGARIVATKPFRLTRDPSQRDQSDVALMTADTGYDVVYAADADGEFARYLPYAIKQPRPVVGASGLVAQAWHWSWDAHGAPQLNHRFEKLAKRRMDSVAWAGWAAVRAVVESVLRTHTTAYDAVRAYLLGDPLTLDGYKGNPMSFRPWDHQLRQPILLATGNAIIARAPIPGFLHRLNDLDTLGVDQPESRCMFNAHTAPAQP